MKICKETCWETADGKLVKDGDDSAAFLFCAKGHTMSDAKVAKFKEADKFFKDAAFDGEGRVIAGAEPKPENREDETGKKLSKRGK